MLLQISQMEDKCQFPSAFGGVNGCYIPIKFPRGGHEGRKENHNLQVFMDFC